MRHCLSELRTSRPLLTAAGAAVLLTLWAGIFSACASAAAGQSLSPSTYQQLTEVHGLIDQQAYDAAALALQRLLEDVQQGSYAKAVVLQTLGYVEVSREAYPAAIRALEQSLALQQLPDNTQQRLRYDLAQLYVEENRTDKAVSILQTWFKQADTPPAEAYVLLGHAYAQQQQYRKAILPLAKAIELADQARADWYEALLAMYYELQSYPDCVPLLENMIRLFPQRHRYWQQLAGVHLALKDYDAALTALELAYRDGALKKEPQLIQLVQLYLYNGIPYKAARLLEEQMRKGNISNNTRHRELLARAWSSARQRMEAIRALEKAISAESTPELRLRLAQWYFEEERWQAAAAILEPLVRNRSTGASDQAWLLLGIARFEQQDREAARQAFLNAAQSADTRASAQQWLEFIGSPAAEGL
jgi:lipopolysaccharide biosynthesis regulator YciM